MNNLRHAAELLREASTLQQDYDDLLAITPFAPGENPCTLQVTLLRHSAFGGKHEIITCTIQPHTFDAIKKVLVADLNPAESVAKRLERATKLSMTEPRQPIKDDISDHVFDVEDEGSEFRAIYPERMAGLAAYYETEDAAWEAIDRDVRKDKAERGVLEEGFYKVKRGDYPWEVAQYGSGVWTTPGMVSECPWHYFDIIGEKVA